jgi:hypothetical protein
MAHTDASDIWEWFERDCNISNPFPVLEVLSCIGVTHVAHLLLFGPEQCLALLPLNPSEAQRFLEALKKLKESERKILNEAGIDDSVTSTKAVTQVNRLYITSETQ